METKFRLRLNTQYDESTIYSALFKGFIYEYTYDLVRDTLAELSLYEKNDILNGLQVIKNNSQDVAFVNLQGWIDNKSKAQTDVLTDGAFKDPVGKIWELADPVVAPAYTAGLVGQPNEIKLKYLADNDFADLSGDALKAAISERIKNKEDDLVGSMASQGTTPRRLTDLIGSLCDLTSGSGDKGTPIVWIQGYFDNYTSDK